MPSVDVRRQLVDALRLDLVGPGECRGIEGVSVGNPHEILPRRPSVWYATGYLVPQDADASQRQDQEADDELDQEGEGGGDDDQEREPTAARARYFPSSVGVSLLVPAELDSLKVIVRWGDYRTRPSEKDEPLPQVWQRKPRQEEVTVSLSERTSQPLEDAVPHSEGLQLVTVVRPLTAPAVEGGLPEGTRSVSVFVVNRRQPKPDDIRDEAYAFQVQLELHGTQPFVARPNLQSLDSDDRDERVADVQYRDVYEFVVGHSIATEAILDAPGRCSTVRTCWIPEAQVERVAPADLDGVELSMDILGQLADGADAQGKLGSLVSEYRRWIADQRHSAPQSPPRRLETVTVLLDRAESAAQRIERGIALLGDAQVREAFRIANRAMAEAARRREGATAIREQRPPRSDPPRWRPFQLAFLLMNLKGIADPADDDRECVDLLFFPTGGGKTEAYLGLAAFTLVLRRLRNPGLTSAGVSVLMRYTLRLLTLDQLSRAATLICALELERQSDIEKLGTWPFEIGLWVGKAATPNQMGVLNDNRHDTARARTIAYKNDTKGKPLPIPLETCPWCGKPFGRNSFQLTPIEKAPLNLRVGCSDRHCQFGGETPLPIVTVDEPIYRRLPCFLIATVDKFAAMPWTGEVGQFFGRVQRYDRDGFYGPCEPGKGTPLPVERLAPPDLIIQDELHLISGPLGTIVGLYETALEELCGQEISGKHVRPKIVASTATVRWAQRQIRALFNRRMVDVFPPPGPNRRDSFFAVTHAPERSHARLYLGLAAQGRSAKVMMLRIYLALLTAAQKAHQAHPKESGPNPADPYMTLLGYFNSLRELGGARRVVEDEVRNQALAYGNRRRVGEVDGPFASRDIGFEPLELTSRVSTADVSVAKDRLAHSFDEPQHANVALATNMISVGLDITRLGLMVVFGQPKMCAEYIQSTSRVGRDPQKPGLVVTILNVHKPRDRSHYERFSAWHASFYRSVEVTSVTPFSPRALDRGLAGTLIAIARHGHAPLTPPLGAGEIVRERMRLEFAIDALVRRAGECCVGETEELERLRHRVRERCGEILDLWAQIAHEKQQVGEGLQYQQEVPHGTRLLYDFLNPELKQLPARHKKFRANRSMRDVEPSVNLRLKRLDGGTIEEEEATP